MATPKLSPKELLECHYRYEQDMLRATYAAISRYEDKAIQNALIESFCVHARNLIEFFEAPSKTRRAKGKEIYRAMDYADETFQPLRDFGDVKKLNGLLNTQIAHLIYGGRTCDLDKKISNDHRAELVKIIQQKSAEFKKSLRSDYQELDVPDWQMISISSDRPRATNVTGSISTHVGKGYAPDVSS
jgi:hypothetical protein